ncbi:PKD domain-containing protein [Flammeovirga aprica]|uniref:PKD domain-containing protein n=1 Tax=Flammeovirga aprica JL-4 TaxID=694437 RepID=A0A7X9P2B1_9BACT|nr:PKD domain-containing protein [Flammeovirga aprica]NME67107.1 PKD domain-containing protein [Flammeovirga aprica JL-4]
MNKSVLRTLLFLIICTLSLLVNRLHAQTIIREYNGTTYSDPNVVISGCGGVAIEFSISPQANHSYSNYQWSRIENSVTQPPFSNLPTPFEQFNTTGVYGMTVTFDEYDSILTTTTTRTITTGLNIIEVFDQPEGSFFADHQSICIGETITLTQTTPGTFTSLSFLVDNQLYPLTGNSTTVTLNNPGDYDVVLSGTTTDGCQFIYRQNDYIHVEKPYSTSFTASQTLSCNTTQNVTFTATSTDIDGGNVSPTYFWDFGDGSLDTTSINTVTHTFDSSLGSDFNVTVGTESNNCSGTVNNSIDIYFRSISTLYGTPTVSGDCDEHILTYTPSAIDPQLVGMNVTWDFGDGSSPTVHSIGDVVSHSFSNATPNPLNVTVTATLNGVADNSCSYTDPQVIPILPQGGISISSNELEYCNENFNVIVQANNLQNVSAFYWVLDGDTGNPIGNNAMIDTIAVSGTGSHTIELYFDAQTGDTNDNCALNSIDVYSAPLTLTAAGQTQACEPANDTFFGSSTWIDQTGTTVTNPFAVDSEEWMVINTVNDDTTYYSTNPLNFSNLGHGSYRITYSMTLDSIGANPQCQYSSIDYLYEVGEVFDYPTLNVDTNPICIRSVVNFSTTTTADTAGLGLSGEYPIIYEYRYGSNLDWVDVGTDGLGTYFYGDIVDDNRTALPGVFQVQLRALVNGCPGEPTTVFITIEPSEAEHEMTTDDCNPTTLSFVNNSLGTADTDYRWTLTITPPSQPAVTWTSPITKDENFNFLAEPDFPTFAGYTQGEIPESSQVFVRIEAMEPGNGCSDTEDTTFFMPGPLPQLAPTPQTSTGTCVNDNLSFDAGDGNLGDTYVWTFTHIADPTIQYTFSSNTSTVNTTFPIPGDYNGTVDVTTTGGCSFNDTVGPIQITGGSVTINGPNNGCVGDNFTFEGVNLMYSPTSPNYTWKVDGVDQASGTATGGNIPDLTGVTFASANSPQSTPHTITLELEVNGCTADYTHSIIVTRPDFSFPAPHSDFISFDYLCDEIVTVVDLDLDDNEVYNLNTSTITYSIGGSPLTPVSQSNDEARLSIAAGTYTMNVNVQDEFGCSSDNTLTFTVPTMRELEADFTPNTTSLVCPGFISFGDSLFETSGHTTRRQDLDNTNTLYDVDISSWEWDFDADGTVDATTTTGSVTHYYDRPGQYKAIVTVTDAQGCQDVSDSVTIEVGGTSGSYEILKKIGFEPATTSMVAHPVMDPNTDITNTIYQWSSGHGLLGSDSLQTFTYNSTIGGVNLSTITPNLTFLDENGCSYPADYSGDMTILKCPDISNPDITLCTDNGPYTLDIEDLSWSSQFSTTDTIETVDYIYTWELQYRWFVDGNPISQVNGGHDTEVTFSFGPIDTNPFVINPDDADGKLYTIQATIIASYVDKNDASNNALNVSECVMTDNIRVIFNPTPVASFTNTEVCGGDATTLDASTTAFGTYTRGTIANYEWDIDNDGTYDFNTASAVSTYTFPGQGVYPVTLRVTSADGCIHQTTEDSVVVNSIPVGDFTYSNVCQSFGIQFNDQSSITPVTDDEIVRWDWDFNNNGTFDIGGTDTLIHRSPQVSFDTLRDNYNTGAIIGTNVVLRPRLRVTTNKGCTFDYVPSTDSLLVFSFDDPVANLSAQRTSDALSNEVCLGQEMQFNDLSTVSNANIASYIGSGVLPAGVNDINAWVWDFGDGNWSSIQNPAHTYANEGTYTVRLMVTTARGCSHNNSITVHVRENPDPEIGTDSLIVCDDQTVSLRPIANDSTNFAYTWSKLTGPTNGTIIENNLNSHTATVDVNESNFNAGESVIDVRYQLGIVDNNHPTACTTFDTVDVQFHRFPNIDLDTTLMACDTSAYYEALPFGAETINGFTYQWTQVYLTGGTVTETSLTDQNFTVRPNSYNDGSTIIRSKYYIDVTNAIGCTDRDSIEFEFYRRPDFASLSHAYPTCNTSNRSLYVVDFHPFGLTESLPHNTAYDYTWSMSSSASDHNVDPSFLSALINQVTASDTVQNLSLDVVEDYFKDDSLNLWFEIDLHVENSFDNTCLKDTSFIVNIERRPRELNLMDPRVDPCNLSVTLNHHTETLDFDYRWRATSTSAEYNGASIPDTYAQTRTLNFTDADFATGESQFTIVMNNRVRKNTSPRCGINRNISLNFFRTPDINFSETWPSGNNCATNVMLSSGSEVIPGFNYTWVQTSVSNGTVNHDATNNKDINLSVGSWNTGETVITVTYELTVTNSASTTCMDVESYTIEFHRTPEISYNPTALNCALVDTVTANNEALNTATFTWVENTVSGGTLNTTDNGNEYIIEVDNFDPTSHRIDGNYTVNIANSTASTCDNDTTFDIVFYRTPDIAFTDTRTDSCALTNTFRPFGTTAITGYNYQWRELYVNGGVITTNTLTDQDLTFNVTSFDQDTAFIDVAYELYVENSDATGCSDIDTVMFQFYRTPNLNVFRKQKPNSECGLTVELYPLDTVEVINHTEGFDYTWILDVSTVTGAPSNTLPASVITDITNQVNTQNFNLNMPLTAFDAGSNEITFELDLNIEHSASGVNCAVDSTILLSFKRPPVIDMVEVKADSCALSTTLQPFGTETITGFNYDWEVVSITNYTNTTYGVGQTFTTQDLNINLVDSDFTPTEAKIEMIVSLEVQNQLSPADSSCIDIVRDTLIFYRTPEIATPFLSNKVNTCDHTATSEPFATNVNGFSYVWTKVGETDGAVTNSSLTDRQITVSLDTFATNSLQVDAQYRLRVFNTEYPDCYDEETVDFEFYRTPEMAFDDPMSYCASIDSSMTFRSTNEAYIHYGSDFYWNLNSISGGTIDSTAGGTEVFTIDVASWDIDAVHIDAEYTLSISNPSTHTCDDDTTFQITFFRTPEIQFASTKTDSCALADVIQPFNGEDIPLFTRTWRQLSVSGGTITQNSTNSDLDLDITANTFDLNSTTITVQYELTAVNSASASCVDKDTVEFYFYRTPNYDNYDEQQPLGFCGGLVQVSPLGLTEVINHNNGFDYTWTLDPTSVSGAGADGNTLSATILNTLSLNENSQNLNASVVDGDYENGAHILRFNMNLNIRHSNSNITCADSSKTVMFQYYRYPDINFSEQKADSCDLTTTLQPFGGEIINGFSYNWEIQNITGYDGSTYAVNDTYTTQNPSFTVTDDDFIDTESVIAITIELTAVNNEATLDNSCRNTQTYTFYFYRTPQIKTNFLSTKAQQCDNTGVASPFDTHINGYVYQWSLDSMSTTNGEVSGVVIDDSGLANRELNVLVDSFTDLHSIMTAHYKLRVINSNQPTCYAEDTVSFRFYRTPEVMLTSMTGSCQNAVMVSSTNEMLLDVDFDWTLISESGGTVVTNPANHDGNRTITFTAVDYDPTESEINSTYMITLLNSGESMCDDDTTFSFTLYRHPEINLTYTRSSADSCANALTIAPYAGEGISGFTNAWSEVSRTGGAITTSSLTDEDLTITLDTFAINSTRIDTRYLLTSFNTNSVACEDSMSLATTLYRQADFTNFNESRADGICGLEMTLSPLGLVENIPHNSGFDYTWSYDSVNVTGADNNILPTAVINSFYSQVNNQNLNLTLPIEAFADGSNKIEIPVTISIENTDQNSCVNAYNHTMVFYRPPVIDIEQSLTSCGVANTITSFGTENVSSAFNFNWSFTEVGGTVTNSSLTDQDLTFTNPVFNNGSDTIRINVALIVENIENTTCQADTAFTFLFYKEPVINFTQSLTGCDSINLIQPHGTEILNGFTYVWEETQRSGGQLGITSGYSLSTQDIELEMVSFDSGSHKIDAEYKLTASNTDTLGNALCSDIDSTSFTILRVPSINIQQTLSAGDCGLTNTITTFGTETITGFVYEWKPVTVLGGTINHSSTTTQNVTFDTPVFDASSHQIDVTYTVVARNAENPTTCFDTETVTFTFYRTPDINLAYTRATADSCSNALTISPFANEAIGSYNNTWSEVSRTGGTITTSTNTNYENITLTVNTFDLNSTRIDTRYLLETYNRNATSCEDSMSIATTLYRQADFTNFNESRADGICGLEMTLSPLGTTEIIAHNSGFDYTWSYDSLNVTGADNNRLPSAVINSFYTQVNSQNLSLTLPLEAFADGSNKIEIPVTISIENTDQNSCVNDYNHTMVFYRPPVIDIQQSLAGCGVTNTITPFGNENVSSAFTFNWSFTEVGGSISNSSLTDQDLTFNNPVFDNGSDTIRINVALTVENNENTTCQADTAFTFLFYKEPVISFTQSITNCDSVNLIRPFGTEVLNGYDYAWQQTQLSGGQVVIASGYSMSTQDIELEKSSFDLGSHKIDARYELTVTNNDTLGNQVCADTESANFTILRVPSIDIQQSLIAGDCGSTNTVTTFGNETISGFVYEWTPQTVTGGTISISSSSTQNVVFDSPTFDPTSNRIDVTYNVVVRNSENPTTCFDTETVSFTFYRTPDATLQPISSVCSSSSILLTTQESYVPNFNYLWTLIDTRVDHNPNTETLVAPQVVQNDNTYTLNSPVDIEGFFPTGSSEITYEYEVSVENSQSPGCTDKDTIEATFFRVPILKSTQSLDSTNCELVNVIRPFGTESIPNYTYNWTELAVNGGTIDVTYLDAQNQDAQFTVTAFDSLSHRIDVSYRVIITNNAGACTGNETYNFTFFRTPQASLSHLNLTLACMDSDVVLFPIDSENVGFTYQWTPISVMTDNGIDLLASNIKPLESNLNTHTLTLNHSPSFPQNAVRVTSVYELTVTNSDNLCTSTDQVTVIFDRDALLSLNVNNFSTCDQNDLTLQTVEPRTDNYTYTWSIDSIYTDNGASISSLSNVNTATVGSMTIDGDPSDFPSGSALITAKYNVHAENQLNADCDADTSYTVTIARQPMISFTDNHAGCALDSVTIKPFGNEIINGFNYNWSIVNIDGYNGNSASLLSSQNNDQNIDIHFSNTDFSTGRSQIEVTFELTVDNPNESGCGDTQQHTLVFFRVPMIDFTVTKAGNDSCANEMTISPFNEVVSDYTYQWSMLSSTNGTVSMANDQVRDLVLNNPVFDQGETRIDLRYQLQITNNNVNASQPCITTEEISVSFFKTPILENDLLTNAIDCNSNAKLKALTFGINSSQEDNYVFDWSINNLSGGTIDTVSVLDSLLIDVNTFNQGSGEINFAINLDAHNTYQYNTCLANDTRSLTFYRTPQISLNTSASDLCEDNQFTITTGEELVSHFDYNWTINITDDIGNNTGAVDSTSNGSRGHELVFSNPTFPIGASYIEIEATLNVSNGNSGCTDSETITLRFHKQPELSITSSSPSSCDSNTITLRPTQNEVTNFTYTWERLSIVSEINTTDGANIGISSMSDYEVTLDSPTFPTGSAQVSAWYKLTVSNPENPYCTMVSDSIEVTFFRSPVTALGEDIQVSCDSTLIATTPINEELIGNFSYNWVINRIDSDKRESDPNAQITINNATEYKPTFEVTNIPDDASSVTAYISLTTENQLNSCGSSTDEIAVTFLRTPTVSLPDDMADCQERTFLLSPNETEWTGMDYEWEVIHSTGGSVNAQNNMNSYLASLSDPVFNSNSFEINSTVVLRVNNKLNANCIAVDTMNIMFHRTPIAHFVVDKGFGCQEELMHFSTRNAEVPHEGSVFEWDFDNNGSYEIQTSGDTTYTFNTVGDHPVNMRIITPAGCISETFTSVVPIHEIPTPSFTFSDICIGEVAQFVNTTAQLTQSGDHGVKAVKWDFDYNETNGALFDAFETNASFQYPEAGTFKVLVEVTNNGGCTNTYIDSITVTPLPVVTLASDIWICEGLTTTLSPEVDVPVSFQWNTGQTTKDIEVAPAKETTYTLTVTNNQGCINTHDITVHVIPDIDMDSEQESCETEAITFDARIPEYEGTVQTYAWSTGETTPTIDVLENGTYSVTTMVEHTSGTMCEFTHEFKATFHPNPEMVLEDTTFCFEFGDLLQVGAVEGNNFTYQWNTGETSRVVTRDRSGVYTVMVTDETHSTRCTTIDTISVNQICPARMNTPNAFTPNGDGINDEFLLEPAYAIDIDLHIFNNWGESIFHKEYKTSFEASSNGNGWNGQYKGADMISGNYTYTIRYVSEKDGSVTEITGQILLIR